MDIPAKWFKQKKWKAFPFQKKTWQAMSENKSGLLNSPTGSGKTYALWFGVLHNYYKKFKRPPKQKQLHCLWITPLRALSKEILLATQQVSKDLELDYTIALRTGDTSVTERAKQRKKSPNALITTPESIHILLASKEYDKFFSGLEFIIVDEWHELMGSKRGVQIELALSRLKALNPELKIWGISATIGNLEEAKDILLGKKGSESSIIKADLDKQISIETIYPDVIEKFSWVGHLGIQLLPKIIPIVEASNSTLIFVNVRSQAEIWYQKLLEAAPHLAGRIAVHHGSLSENIRKWVEDNLHEGNLKAVVCTSSLDLGVDFRSVDTVIQVGSSKGIARFIQRAGRSGHYPGALSRSYFVPTNSLEIIEGSALKAAIADHLVEQRIPYVRSFDVLVQYLVTLAVSNGFPAEEIFKEVKGTHCFESITQEEFTWCLQFITNGGTSLKAYSDYHKVVVENGIYKVTNKSIAMRHRLSIGTIVSDSMMSVKFMGGKKIGVVEEWFISQLKPGDSFWFGGKNLEVVSVKDMEVRVRSSKKKTGKAPAFLGGRLPLSSQLSQSIRLQLNDFKNNDIHYEELRQLAPLLDLQQKVSHLPGKDELLIEQFKTRDGYHTFVYPFEGRFVHEGMAAILAYRIGLLEPFTFSIGMNDYGFELLSDKPLNMEMVIDNNLFSPEFLYDDALKSMNAIEMAKRRFRDIATIAGLVFTGYPGKQKKTRHLQASAQLFFKVFEDYDKDNLLFRQAYDETLDFQLEITRMQTAFKRISVQKIIITNPNKPTPFSFPILVDTLRERFSNEDFQTRIDKILNLVI
ncbi:MAG: ligase-associated DNA damage response DEXH box helicase [Bacteroidetes bacterium]|nr:ligase-associated DNA damage response DEXH box helicase [Bacteroidota bacterium]